MRKFSLLLATFLLAVLLLACSSAPAEEKSPVTFSEGNFYDVAAAPGGGSYRIGTDALPEGLAAKTASGVVDLSNYGTNLGYTEVTATVRGVNVAVRSVYTVDICQVSYDGEAYQEASDGNCDVTVYGSDWAAVFVSDGLDWQIAVK
jgi:ABC-type oligopeptide transport system substrate-binding subunit